VKNLPAGCSHSELCGILDILSLGGLYNFVYVPFDFKKCVLFRYGFVNFEQHEHAVKAMAILDGFSGWVVDGEKACVVEWSGARQSLQAIIERYRNSPVMHSSVPEVYKPLMFERGARVAFPAPTQDVDPPKRVNPSAAWSVQVRNEPSPANVEADKLKAHAEEAQRLAQPTEVKQTTARSPETIAAVTEQLATAVDGRTTLIVKNLPAGCTHLELRRILDELGFDGLYNFIYVPFLFDKSVILGYGLVNFEQHDHAVKAQAILNGFSSWPVDDDKCCEVEWGGAQQSLHAHIERYRNSPVMHSSVPDTYKPVVFDKGVRIPFPAPTRAVKPPKFRRARQA